MTIEPIKLAKKLPIQDILGILIVSVLLPIGFVYEITFVLSFWYTIFSEEWFVRVIPLLMFGLNAYLNILQLIRVGPNGVFFTTTLPSVLKPGYKFCHTCNINSPPRSHHCPVCNTCIYRRDHHSSFAGVCVGHFNHRYFVGAICNFWIVSLVCCIWNWNILWRFVTPKFALTQIWQLMVPHLALIFGFISFFQFFAIFTFVCSAIAFAFVCYLIAAQIFCIWRGQTRVEYLLDVKAYDLGTFHQNLRESLGERWALIFISPFLDTRLLSDGISFRIKDRENFIIQKNILYACVSGNFESPENMKISKNKKTG